VLIGEQCIKMRQSLQNKLLRDKHPAAANFPVEWPTSDAEDSD
jgi:hypothetical protein